MNTLPPSARPKRRPPVSAALRRAAAADARAALAEDLGPGDLSAALLPRGERVARLICRRPTVLCGAPWFEACFLALSRRAKIQWRRQEGDNLRGGGERVATVRAPARALLAAERSALNFLQTLSGTAQTARRWQLAAGDALLVVDTRKTLPLLRRAQKYAVCVGGAGNHRQGLFDEILIKENHIAACGDLRAAIAAAHKRAGARRTQVEARNRRELALAVAAGARRVLLDNFSLADLRRAARETPAVVELEASGNVALARLPAIAASGVARVSVGALTKNVTAADYSLLLEGA